MLGFELLHIISELGLKEFKTYLLLEPLHRGGNGAWEPSGNTFLSLPFPPVFPFLGKAVLDPSGRANGGHDVNSWYEHE